MIAVLTSHVSCTTIEVLEGFDTSHAGLLKVLTGFCRLIKPNPRHGLLGPLWHLITIDLVVMKQFERAFLMIRLLIRHVAINGALAYLNFVLSLFFFLLSFAFLALTAFLFTPMSLFIFLFLLQEGHFVLWHPGSVILFAELTQRLDHILELEEHRALHVCLFGS